MKHAYRSSTFHGLSCGKGQGGRCPVSLFRPQIKCLKFTDDNGISEGAVDLGGPMREFFSFDSGSLAQFTVVLWT